MTKIKAARYSPRERLYTTLIKAKAYWNIEDYFISSLSGFTDLQPTHIPSPPDFQGFSSLLTFMY